MGTEFDLPGVGASVDAQSQPFVYLDQHVWYRPYGLAHPIGESLCPPRRYMVTVRNRKYHSDNRPSPKKYALSAVTFVYLKKIYNGPHVYDRQ